MKKEQHQNKGSCLHVPLRLPLQVLLPGEQVPPAEPELGHSVGVFSLGEQAALRLLQSPRSSPSIVTSGTLHLLADPALGADYGES